MAIIDNKLIIGDDKLIIIDNRSAIMKNKSIVKMSNKTDMDNRFDAKTGNQIDAKPNNTRLL